MIALVVQIVAVLPVLLLILLIVGWLLALVISFALYGAEAVFSRIVGRS